MTTDRAWSSGAARTNARVVPLARDLVALTKPRITALVVLTSATGMWLAPEGVSARDGFLSLAGTSLVVGAANALNMWWERDVDARMARTRSRPLPSGRLSPDVALAFGLALAIASLAMLFAINVATGLLALLALVTYVGVYTPLKRRTHWALQVGAVPGAIPPLLGWASATSTIGVGGLELFAMLFFWQAAHFGAIAIVREADYRAAGLMVVSVQRGPRFARLTIACSAVLVVAASIVVGTSRIGGDVSLGVACAGGAAFVALALRGLRRDASARWAQQVFASSNVYLAALLVALLLERTLR